jgi:hypothetical protein
VDLDPCCGQASRTGVRHDADTPYAGEPNPPRLGTVRLSAFWTLMRNHFGPGYAESVAHDHVLAALGGRTVDEALAGGEDAKKVWRAVCEEFEVPAARR